MSNFVRGKSMLQLHTQLFSGTKVKLQQTGRNLRQDLGDFKHRKPGFSYSSPSQTYTSDIPTQQSADETTEVGKNPAVMYGAELKLFELKDGCSSIQTA